MGADVGERFGWRVAAVPSGVWISSSFKSPLNSFRTGEVYRYRVTVDGFEDRPSGLFVGETQQPNSRLGEELKVYTDPNTQTEWIGVGSLWGSGNYFVGGSVYVGTR
jgi:hypothetical protein